MGLWKNLKNLFSSQQKAVQQINSWSGPGYDFSAWSGMDQSQDAHLTTNEEIFAAVSHVANIFSSLPLHEYQKGTEKNTPISDLLRSSPNMNQTGYEFIRQLEVDRNVAGNGFAWIERDPATQTPIALWPLKPGTVTVMRNVEDNSIWYRVDDNQHHHFLVFNTDIIHVKHISATGGFMGISPIDVLTRSLRFQRQIEDFSLSEMGKKEAYIIKYDRSVSNEGRKAILDDFRKMVKANGGAVLVQAGFDIDRYESKFKPSDLSQVEQISRIRIANAFNIPVSFLNDGSSKATVNVEHVMTDYVVNALNSTLKQYESEFNRKLLTRNQRSRGYYFKFSVAGLMRGDTAARTQYYQTLIRNGLITPNELRRLEDLPPVKEPNANKLWFSGDLYPIELAGQRQPNNKNVVDDSSKSTTKGGDNSNDQSNKDSDSNNNADIPDSQAGGSKERGKYVY